MPKIEKISSKVTVDNYENSDIYKYQGITLNSFLAGKDCVKNIIPIILESTCDAIDNKFGTIQGKLLDNSNSNDDKFFFS